MQIGKKQQYSQIIWRNIQGTIFLRLHLVLVSFFLFLFLSSCGLLIHPLVICALNNNDCDTDGDGIFDGNDNCPDKNNTRQEDDDSDEVGNACDNCVKVSNLDQEDTDTDGTGDACDENISLPEPLPPLPEPSDPDPDGDGINDFISGTTTPLDLCPLSKNTGFFTSIVSNDFDRDGCEDAEEDPDDDNDEVNDFVSGTTTPLDLCPLSNNTGFFTSNISNDFDRDGCEDAEEDVDDNGNGLIEIQNAEMLNNIRHDVSGQSYVGSKQGCGRLAGDICTGYELEGTIGLIDPWTPIADDFVAIFNGNGHTIANLRIFGSGGNLGFFRSIGINGVVQNLDIREVSITGTGDSVGSLVGVLNSQGRIERVTISNSDLDTSGLIATASSSLGGLVGSSAGTISDSSTSVRVANDASSTIGGLVGENTGTIDNSHATGKVVNVNGSFVGGLAGKNEGTITNAYAAGTVEGNESVGGLVGQNSETIENSHSTGTNDINGKGSFVGGLVGQNSKTITNSYSTKGVIGGGEDIGGLVGQNSGEITNVYATGSTRGAQSGVNNIGGLVGTNSTEGSITNAYATGNVDGDIIIGRLVGDNEGSITNAYADTIYSGVIVGTGDTTGTSAQDVKALTDLSSAWSNANDNWHFGTTSEYPSLRSTEAINGEYLLLCGQIAPQVLTTSETRPADQQCSFP